MKPSVPLLTPILRSNTQGDILALLFTHVEKEFSLAEITRRVGSLPAVVHREVERLTSAGIARDRYEGRSRLIRVNTEHQMYQPLSEIVLLGYGPKVVVEKIFSKLKGIAELYIYGSWAARYLGEPGGIPQDIDVLVVGGTQRSELEEASRLAEQELRREVNTVRVSEADWQSKEKPFIRTIAERPMVKLHLQE